MIGPPPSQHFGFVSAQILGIALQVSHVNPGTSQGNMFQGLDEKLCAEMSTLCENLCI